MPQKPNAKKFTSPKFPSIHRTRKNVVGKFPSIWVALCVGVLIALAFSLSVRPMLTTSAQEQKPSPVSQTTSLVEATAAGQVDTKAEIAPAADPVADPEGGVCSWVAGTVTTAPVLDQATVSVGNNIYTFGGVSNSVIIANSFKFDGTTWTPIAPLPAALEFPTAVTDGTNIYVLGGALVGTGAPQTTLYRYNVGTNDYTTLAPFTVPTWNQAAAFLNGKIYKFAGTSTAASTNALEIYDIAGNSWTTGAVYPQLNSFVSAFVRNGFVYGAGGIASVGSVASLKTFRYDPVGNAWDDAAIADLPQTRWGAASSGVGYGSNNGWVLAGGYVNGTVTANISTTVIRWDPVGNAWVSLTNMSVGERSRFGGAILNSSFYAIGGRSVASSAFVGTNSNQKFTCVSNVAVVNQGTVTITAEGCGTPNGAPDPGENLTVALPLTNSGDIPTTNLTATLQATGGVTNPGPAQNYGAVPPGGQAVSRNFTFTADPNTACGGSITLTWLISDGGTNYPNATKTYVTGVRTLSLAQNFDAVSVPTLPAGWTNTQTSGTGINWNTVSDTPSSAPNAAFANDPIGVSAATLTSPSVLIGSADAQISFKNKYITESTFDGMVLEYSTNAGSSWTDVITGGGSFVSGGYNGLISANFMSPILGRMAWTGTSAGGFIDTVINLPAALNGQTVIFRWMMASDTTVASTGVWVDDIQVFGARVCNSCGGPLSKARSDFDGDGKTDVSVVRGGTWYINRSTAGFKADNFGLAGDRLVPGDYDGDGKTDEAVRRGGTTWYIRGSTAGDSAFNFGSPGDIPVTGDYDGDGKTDIAVYRPSSATWFIRRSSTGVVVGSKWGADGDIPVVGDFDGDGKADLTVFRPAAPNFTCLWHTLTSQGAYKVGGWGISTDKLVPADYDGDGKDDYAVFRNGIWYILGSSNSVQHTISWGSVDDVLVPGDYNGDGKYDVAVFRNGTWYILEGGTGLLPPNPRTEFFGQGGDFAVPRLYSPQAYVPEQ